MMKPMRSLAMQLLLFSCCGCAFAGGFTGPAQPLVPIQPPAGVRLAQRLDAQLPLGLRFTDSEGRSAPLSAAFGDRPVLLVLGYLRCPQLCGLVMHGLLDALHGTGLKRDEFRIVRVSIDPDDTPQTARERREADLGYADFLAQDDRGHAPRSSQPSVDLRVLTGDATAIGQLTRAAGFDFVRSSDDAGAPDAARFAHPATVIVATPQGRIAQYLMGVQFDAPELRLALVDAGGGRIGSLTDRIALLCAHFDPKFGLHTNAVLWTTRAMGFGLVVLLAALWWRQRQPGRIPGGKRA